MNEYNVWYRCTDDNYPTDDAFVVISFYDESDDKWYYWSYNECPYGWNILIRNKSYWMQISNPE